MSERALRRARQREAERRNTLPPGPWIKKDLEKVPFVPKGCTEAYINNRYTITVYDGHATTHGPAKRVMIQNHANEPIANHWSEVNKIKNELFGPDVVAVEYYPSASELIDAFNIYWIWIYPANVLPIPVMK